MIPYGHSDFLNCGTVPQFPPRFQAFTACLEMMPHWLSTSFVLVAAGFAVLLLVGLFQPATARPFTNFRHEDSL